MADLSSIERRKLERLLRMGGGYVKPLGFRHFQGHNGPSRVNQTNGVFLHFSDSFG